MKNFKNNLTRRDFVKGAGMAAAGVAIGMPLLAEELNNIDTKSTVVLVRNEDAVDSKGNINGEIIQQMLDQGVTTFFGKDDPVACWKQIIKPDDVVGIKTNVWSPLPTTTQVEQAIRKRVLDAGVSEHNIAIDDHGVLRNPVFQKATALINARPLRTHAWSGVGSLIKNYIMFSPNPPDYHPNSCADLGSLWHLPIVKGKTRLNVLVLLTPMFYGIGPHHFDTSYVWPYKGLLVGSDPVALDTIGLHLFQTKRREHFGEDKPIKPSAHHVAFADKRHNLGTSDLNRIKLVKVGWEKDILI